MKPCPQCNRVETDDALAFCRADGTALISDSGSVSAETGTVKFGSAPVGSEIETSVLPSTITDAGISRPTAPTTVLPSQHAQENTRALSKPKRRKAIVAIAALIAVALIAGAYPYWPRGLYLTIFERNRSGAEKELRRAIELNPNYATAHHWLGLDILAPTKRFDEALVEMRRAEELDPLSSIIVTEVGGCLLMARHYDEAIAQFKHGLSLDPKFYHAHVYLGWGFNAKGMYREAIDEYRKALELNDDPTAKAFLALSLAKSGQRGEAIKLRDQLKLESSHRYVSSYCFAILHIALGEKDEAFVWLEKDIGERSSWPVLYAVAPELDDLRDDPRFKDMLKRLNLPE